MKTEHNGTQFDALRACRVYDMLCVLLQVDKSGHQAFIDAAARGDAVVPLTRAPLRPDERNPGLVFLNQHGIWAVGCNPADATLDTLELCYAVTVRLKGYLTAHYMSGAPGPEIDQQPESQNEPKLEAKKEGEQSVH